MDRLPIVGAVKADSKLSRGTARGKLLAASTLTPHTPKLSSKRNFRFRSRHSSGDVQKRGSV